MLSFHFSRSFSSAKVNNKHELLNSIPGNRCSSNSITRSIEWIFVLDVSVCWKLSLITITFRRVTYGWKCAIGSETNLRKVHTFSKGNPKTTCGFSFRCECNFFPSSRFFLAFYLFFGFLAAFTASGICQDLTILIFTNCTVHPSPRPIVIPLNSTVNSAICCSVFLCSFHSFSKVKIVACFVAKQLSGFLLLFYSMNKRKFISQKTKTAKRRRQTKCEKKEKRAQIARQNEIVIRKLRVVAFKFIHKTVCAALLYGDDEWMNERRRNVVHINMHIIAVCVWLALPRNGNLTHWQRFHGNHFTDAAKMAHKPSERVKGRTESDGVRKCIDVESSRLNFGVNLECVEYLSFLLFFFHFDVGCYFAYAKMNCIIRTETDKPTSKRCAKMRMHAIFSSRVHWKALRHI